ncbi:MAG: electron transfer flavoprotein subunit alpha/FixB family protein [Chloroflexi bacterium]|nr:electron transfer flavoprotein subunit alpha/FixB family protein [Chloroflexota bacterium]
MGEIFVLAEHRRGELRDVTFEMLGKGQELAAATGGSLSAVLLGHDVGDFATELTKHANQVLVIADARLEHFNSAAYQQVLTSLITERQPRLVLMGHSAYGMDLAPSLATQLDLPLVTDCVGLEFEDGDLFAVREMYGGKVSAKVAFRPADTYVATLRQAAFPFAEGAPLGGEIVAVDSPLTEEITYRRFLEFVEAAVGEVDITQADVVVAVGRGIKEQENMSLVEKLAEALGGVLAGSRPVVDAGWLPPDRQVGQSGKTVKPKLYLALGISGASQHLVGMKASSTIVAVNKDPDAPIFRVAHYGIVGDLFKVVPALTAQLGG